MRLSNPSPRHISVAGDAKPKTNSSEKDFRISPQILSPREKARHSHLSVKINSEQTSPLRSPKRTNVAVVSNSLEIKSANFSPRRIKALPSSPFTPGTKGRNVTTETPSRKRSAIVTEDEIKTVFLMLEEDKSLNGSLSILGLKKKLGALFPDLSHKDYRFLLNDQRRLSLKEFTAMLLDEEEGLEEGRSDVDLALEHFDAVEEAFRFYDPSAEGHVDKARLRELFTIFDYGPISDEEFDMLMRVADADGDGTVSVEDFRNLIDPNPYAAGTTSVTNGRIISPSAKIKQIQL